MSMNINGLHFGGNVWSFGSVDAFKTAYEEVRNSSSHAAGTVAKSSKKATKDPVDTGLTRYLSSTGNVEQKLAHLHEINKFVDDFRLTAASEDELPETQELNKMEALKKYLSPEELSKRVLANDGGVDGAAKVLAQMLEKKLLAAKPKAAGGSPAQLSAEERAKINQVCRTAIAKTFQAYTLERVATFIAQNGQMPSDVAQDVQLARASGELGAILNTALGAAELLLDGRISENSVVTLLRDGSLVDLANTLDVTLMLQKAAACAKEQFTQKAELEAMLKRPHLTDADRTAIQNVIVAREQFTRVLDFEIHEHDPFGKLSDEKFQAQQLQDVKLRLQQFRYDLERCTGQVGREFGHGKYSYYGIMEQIRRACSNLKGDRHLGDRFKTDAARNKAFDDLLQAEAKLPSALPKKLRTSVARRAATACGTTHEANVGARMSQNTAAARRTEDDYANKVLDLLEKTGGMQMTKTEIAVSAAVELGDPNLVSGQVSVGGFYQTSAAVVAFKGGGCLLVLSKEAGGRVSAKAQAAATVAEAKIEIEGGSGKETTLFFSSRKELLAYCRLNCPKLLSAIPGTFSDLADRDLVGKEVFAGLKRELSLVRGFEKVGKFLGNMFGTRVHKTKYFTEANFENKMRRNGVFSNLNGVMYRRLNALPQSSTATSTSFGSMETGVGLDVGTESAGASVSVGATFAGATTTSRTKGLKSIQSFVSMHTADEMKRTVLPDLFDDFAEYQQTAPEKYRHGNVVKILDKFLNDEPPDASPEACAEFWSRQISDLAARYRKLEGDYSAPLRGKKANRELQIDFARQTRLYAAVNEYLAKRIESELATVRAPKAKTALASALKVARESLGATLERSNILLQPDIVQEHLRFGRQIFAGKTRGFSFTAEVGWNVGINKTEASSEASSDASANAATNAVVSVFKDAFMDAMGTLKADGEKALNSFLGFSGKVSGKLAYTRYVQKGESVKPWMNMNSLKFEFDVSYPLGPLPLIETFVKLVEKAKAESPNDKHRAQMLDRVARDFAVELGKQLGSSTLASLDNAAVSLVTPFTPLSNLVNGMSKVLEKVGVTLGMTTSNDNTKGAKLLLVVENMKLTECKMSDYVQNKKKLEIKAKAGKLPGSLSFTKTDTKKREQVVFDMLPHATLGTLLSHGVGPLGKDKNTALDFLCKNQTAANDVVKSLRDTKVPGEVIYDNAQVQAIRDGLENLMKLGTTADVKIPAKMKAAAKAAYKDAIQAWSNLANPPPSTEKESDAARNNLLVDLTQKLFKAYGLLDSAQQLGWSVPNGGK